MGKCNYTKTYKIMSNVQKTYVKYNTIVLF